jgi:hypothetical protein
MQVGYTYIDISKLPYDEHIDEWFPVLVIKKLMYKACKPHLHLSLYKASSPTYIVSGVVPQPTQAQLVYLQPAVEDTIETHLLAAHYTPFNFASVSHLAVTLNISHLT